MLARLYLPSIVKGLLRREELEARGREQGSRAELGGREIGNVKGKCLVRAGGSRVFCCVCVVFYFGFGYDRALRVSSSGVHVPNG